MTWPLSTDEGRSPKQTNPAINLKEDMLQDEEVTNQDPDSKEEEVQAAETTQTGMTNSATSAKFKGIGKKKCQK